MKPYIKPSNIGVILAKKGEPVAEPIPNATVVKQFKKMEVISPAVVSLSGQERRRQRREIERKFKLK